ncbi:MAG TPA: hypothetical protein VFQ68_30870, partial [Streptosporangiaceae bacterium]|nr:hypothetical protein [Streptosporangiaceae bacterium]
MFCAIAANRTLFWSLAILLLLVSVGCGMPLFSATDTVSEVFDTTATPKIVVETFNGSIDISNGADDEVVVEVNKRASGFDQASADRNLENIEVSIDQEEGEIRVTVRRHGYTVGDSGGSVVIAAPQGATIDLKTSNGYIISEGMQGGIEAVSSNARVDVFEGKGEIDVDSSNGNIHIEATDAIVDAHTSNARIEF